MRRAWYYYPSKLTLRGLLGHNGQSDRYGYVRVQLQLDFVLTGYPQQAFRQTNSLFSTSVPAAVMA